MKTLLHHPRLYVAIICGLFLGTAKAQYVTITDTAFASFLQQNYAGCMNGNQLDTACPAIKNADTVICQSHQVRDFTGIQYFRHLSYLDISNNFVLVNPILPDSLVYFSCQLDGLDSLPTLPGTLRTLICISNHLTALPAALPQLYTLECGNNNLKHLPELPTSLNFLLCFNDSLTSLPALPDSLTNLECPFNQLTYLPPIPRYLNTLDCSYNPFLTTIPNLPDSLGNFLCVYDSNLKCLPPLRKFTGVDGEIVLQGSGISCLPNVIEHNGIILAIDTMPICSLFNPNDCPIAWNIEGVTFQDLNSDCIFDSTEQELTGVKMNLYQDSVLLQSAIFGGEYSFKAVSGTYVVTVDTTNTPFYPGCFSDSTVSLTNLDSMVYNVNFGLQCKPGFDVGAKSIAGKFRPAFTTELYIGAGDVSNFYNGHCSAGVSGNVFVVINGPAHYVSPALGALTPFSTTGDSIIWNVPDFGTTNFNSSFNIMVKTDSDAITGTPVCITTIVTPVAGDNNPANNTLTQCIGVVNSFDPNYKESYPLSDVDSSDGWITYTIHFQNTGTDTAVNVVILDTLDANLNPASLEILSYSSKPIVQVWYKIVQFNFPSINLPDSSVNAVLSQGYVQYRVQLNSNRSLGTQVQNTAHIYFDSNAPVATNTTFNTINHVATGGSSVPTGGRLGVRIFPNPANDKLFIITTDFTPDWVTIYDVSGQRVSQQRFASPIDIRALTPGIYLVEVSGNNNAFRNKIVKIKED